VKAAGILLRFGLAMIRFVLRFIGLWILAAAFIFLIYDGTKSIADRVIYITKIGDVWSAVHQNSLLALKPAIERYVAWLWDPAMTTFLAQPTWLVLGIFGIVLTLLGRKKKPLIGYGR
jgi:hypothetical protein